MLTEQVYGKAYDASPAENYQRYFVPSIGRPVADDLAAKADFRRGERVLDVACGTGVVTRLAAERVGAQGRVVGLDVNQGMLEVARSDTPLDLPIEWCEASAESMPFAANSFDVALCQMGLQFVPDKSAVLHEMWRVLDDGGRVYITLPGPKPPLFAIMTDALARHVSPQAAAFGDLVFSMHDADQLTGLLRGAGFREVEVEAKNKGLQLPTPAEFLWQYINSTPIGEVAAKVDETARVELEREIVAQWQDFVQDGSLSLQVGMTTAKALK